MKNSELGVGPSKLEVGDLIATRVTEIVANIQRLIQWGEEEAARHSAHMLTPSDTEGVLLYQGVRQEIDETVLGGVYEQLGIADERNKSQPEHSDNEEGVSHRFSIGWGITLHELRELDPDGRCTLYELWGKRD